MQPYKDLEKTDRYIIREFGDDINPVELYWHRDDEDRSVEIIECGEGWKMQYDNQLPINLTEGITLFILRHEWHRVIKGSGDLLIKIYKYGKEKKSN